MKSFFEATPKSIDRALAIIIVLVGIALTSAISRSSNLTINRDGINLQRELQQTTAERDRAVTVVKICKQGFSQIEQETAEFAQNNPAGSEILDDLVQVQSFVEAAEPDRLFDEQIDPDLNQ